MRRSKLPTYLAALAALVGAWVGWRLVRGDVSMFESAGWTAGPEMGLVLFLAAGGAVAVFYSARRIADGPNLARTGWHLTFQGPVKARAGELAALLAKRGYQLELTELDEVAQPLKPAAPDLLLTGAQLGLVAPERRVGQSRVVLRLSVPSEPDHLGLGLIESEDTPTGFYDELGQYVIAALAELFPGLTFKRADSSIDFQPAESLAKLLPEKPSHLDPHRL